MPPLVTVVLLLYNARQMVHALIEAVRRQTHPDFERQSDWLECIIMDDRSTDGTVDEVRKLLAELPENPNYRLEAHAENQGLARTMNQAFELARAQYVLTCHCDCLFGDNRYVARLLELMVRTPNAGAITGKPALQPGRSLPFVERLNAVSNLMDILPVDLDEVLLPVGFAEGRCDIFRVEAMRAAGMYPQSYRTSGEDQALAGRMRQHGYSLYQAPAAIYFLSVSREQDTLGKLLRHAWLFGKTHPLLLFGDPGTREGIIGGTAGRNRRARGLLRALQVISVAGYSVIVVSPLFQIPLFAVGVVLAAIVAAKLRLFHRHIAQVGFSSTEWIAWLAFQPVLDVAYVAGLCKGAVLLASGWRRTRTAV